MTDLTVFNNEEFGSVRTCTLDGKPYFVGKDVAEILGYSNPRDALAKHVDDEDKTDGVAICDSIGREQNPTLINESGLYSLILRSQLPKAKQFKRWVTHEVLPSIRKHGMYAMDEIIANPDLAINALMALKAEREEKQKLEWQNACQKQQLAELQPKASYYDLILHSTSTMPITLIAKDYGMSARKFNETLHDCGVQYKFQDTWLLYQKYAEQGYTQSRTYAVDAEKTVMHTYWTQKGRIFLYELLKKHNILPRMEREAQ